MKYDLIIKVGASHEVEYYHKGWVKTWSSEVTQRYTSRMKCIKGIEVWLRYEVGIYHRG